MSKLAVFSSEQRRVVELLSSFGLTQAQLSAVFRSDARTLKHHCSHEIDRGRMKFQTQRIAGLLNEIPGNGRQRIRQRGGSGGAPSAAARPLSEDEHHV